MVNGHPRQQSASTDREGRVDFSLCSSKHTYVSKGGRGQACN